MCTMSGSIFSLNFLNTQRQYFYNSLILKTTFRAAGRGSVLVFSIKDRTANAAQKMF